MSSILYTRRLTLRPVTAAHIAALFAIFREEKAVHFMPTPPHQSMEETRTWLERERAKEGAHFWAVCLRDDTRTGAPEPAIGYVHFVGESRLPGMGIVIHPRHWGCGYAPEACRAALDYGFAQLEYEQIEVWIDERNRASRRVAQKLGFRASGRLLHMYRHQRDPHWVLTYGIAAREWREMAVGSGRPATPAVPAEGILALPAG